MLPQEQEVVVGGELGFLAVPGSNER